MAVVLSFEICQSSDCKSLVFKETTGTYSTSNTSGWGAPNESTSDATAATLKVESFDNATNTYTTLSTIDVFISGFPTTNSGQELYIPSSSIGFTSGAKITDGIYVFTYSVTTGTTTYTQVRTAYFFCQVRCCVLKMAANIPADDCDCNQEKIDRAFKAKSFLLGLEDASTCNKADKFTDLLALINKLCNFTDCSSCN